MQHLLFALVLALHPAVQEPTPAAPVDASLAPADQAPDEAAEPAAPELIPLGPNMAARAYEADGPSTEISFAELDPILLERHGVRPEGEDVLKRLLNSEILRSIAAEKGVTITDAMATARIVELDKLLLAQGMEGGLARQLVENDVDPDIFRESLVLSLMQEELVRLSLGLPKGERPGVGPQNAWMDTTLAARNTEYFNDPFPTNPSAPVAQSDEIVITMDAFQKRLRDELPRPFVEQAITQLVLQKRMQESAGKIEPAVWDAAIDLEIDRRRERHNANPTTQGVTYEQLLDAQGLSISALRSDPAVIATALTSVLAWREAEDKARAAGNTATGEALRDAGRRLIYAEEQELFDNAFGEKLKLASCVLRSKEVPDEVVTRSTKEAMDYLKRLAPGIPDREGFELIVNQISEDVNAKQTKGELGWFGRGGSPMPQDILDLAFAYWESKGTPGVAGPIEIPGGVALFWVGPHRPAPEWAVMSQAVQTELQARCLNDAFPGAGLQIFRDPPVQVAPVEQVEPVAGDSDQPQDE
jgi:hypothetical protein